MIIKRDTIEGTCNYFQINIQVMTISKCSLSYSRCALWEKEVTQSQEWCNACTHCLTYCKWRKAWMICKGLSSAYASVCVHARACNICVGKRERMENPEVGEGGVCCWWCNELHTRNGFLFTGPAISLWLLPGQWLGNYEECLETISFFWTHGWSRKEWMAFLFLSFFFNIYSAD